MRSPCKLLLVALAMCTGPVWAQSIPLNALDETEFKDIVSEISTDLMHTSVSGASTLGDIFGVEVGLVGGVTKTPNINKVVQAVDADAKAEQIYHGELLGVVTVPLGFTIEAGFIPKIGSKEFKFNSMSLAAKWTPTGLLLDWPLNLAAKAQITKAHMAFSSTSGGSDTSYTYDGTIFGLGIFASKNFAIVEPYVGLGMANSTGELGATGNFASTLFSYTSATAASEKVSGMYWALGAEFKLVLLKLGIEYSNMYDTSRYSGKISFYF